MFGIREETLKRLREEYPKGCRVELVHMDDPYERRQEQWQEQLQ